MASNRDNARGLPRLINVPGTRVFAALLTALALGYIAWKIGQAPPQALQFAFNGLAVGAVYALLAMGFTLVYSTVWFFDLYYGAAAALGAYGVFYLRTDPSLGSRLDINSVPVNVVFGLGGCGCGRSGHCTPSLEPRSAGTCPARDVARSAPVSPSPAWPRGFTPRRCFRIRSTCTSP